MWNINLCHHLIRHVRSNTSRIWTNTWCVRYSHRSHAKHEHLKSVRYTLSNAEAETVARLINRHRVYKDGVLVEINAGHGSLTKALVQHVKKNYWCMESREFLTDLKEIVDSAGHNMLVSDLNILTKNADIKAEEKVISTFDLHGAFDASVICLLASVKNRQNTKGKSIIAGVPMTMVGVLHHTKMSGKPFMLNLVKRLFLNEGFFHLQPSEFFLICDPELVRLWLTSISPDHQSTHVGLQMDLFFDIDILHKIPLDCFQPPYPVRKKFRKIIIDGEEVTGEHAYLIHMVSQPLYEDLSVIDFLRFSNFTKDSSRIGKQGIVEKIESLLPGSEAALLNNGFTHRQKQKMLTAQQLFHIYKIVTSLPGYEESVLQHQLEDSIGCHSHVHNISDHLTFKQTKQLLPAKTSAREIACTLELPSCTETMSSHNEDISTINFKVTSQQKDSMSETHPCDTKSVIAGEEESLCLSQEDHSTSICSFSNKKTSKVDFKGNEKSFLYQEEIFSLEPEYITLPTCNTVNEEEFEAFCLLQDVTGENVKYSKSVPRCIVSNSSDVLMTDQEFECWTHLRPETSLSELEETYSTFPLSNY